jgi:hypothetical protein
MAGPSKKMRRRHYMSYCERMNAVISESIYGIIMTVK